jgi:hypothetical protein
MSWSMVVGRVREVSWVCPLEHHAGTMDAPVSAIAGADRGR